MAVQAQFGGLAGWLPPCGGGGGGLADEQMQQALLLSAAAAGDSKACQFNCAPCVASAAQSELTCNGVVASRKRGREGEQHASSYSAAALLPIPGMEREAVARPSRSRLAQPAAPSTSGRAASASAADAVVAELWRRQAAEVDALVRAQCERLSAGVEQARKRQRQAVVRAVAASAARALREKETQVAAARRRVLELEERLRQAAAESQAWCGLARSNEAVASGLRATLDTLLLRAAAAGAPAEEGSGESDPAVVAAADDALSCFFVVEKETATDDGAASSSRAVSRRACRACGAGEATVLVLPCRHLCLCKACEPRADACPVCLAAKNASIHVAAI